MSEHGIKVVFISITSVLSSLLGILYVPVLLMVLCNLIDYVTGLMAAGSRGGISSYKSIKGITKKVAMWLLVVVGAIIDNLILYCSDTVGFHMPINFLVAAIVAVWIICNELISILENMLDIGIKIPAFLKPLVEKIKKQTENIAEGADNGNDNKTS